MVFQWVLSDCQLKIHNDQVITVVFNDIQRAFETRDMNILINKLINLSHCPSTLQWFTDYQ